MKLGGERARMAKTAQGRFEVRASWTDAEGARCEGRWHRPSRARAAGLCQVLALAASKSLDGGEVLNAAGPPSVLIRQLVARNCRR